MKLLKVFLEAVTGRPALEISDETFKYIVKNFEDGESLCRELNRLQSERPKSINELFRLVGKVREASEEKGKKFIPGGPEPYNSEARRRIAEILRLLDEPDTEEKAEALANLFNEHQKAKLERETIEKRLRVTPLLIPLAEHGRTFIESKRGYDKTTALLDQELRKILLQKGADAQMESVITEIEAKVENIHDFFQEVDRERKLVFIRNPENRQEKTRSFKTISNRITALKKCL